jgi:hypothetical protein
MLATVRDATGTWRMWRVGRRRLAWRPHYHGWIVDADDGHGILLIVNLLPLVGYLANWVAALAATAAAWPHRAFTGTWPVVAYMLDPDGGDGLRRADVRGQREADELARQWVLDIKQHGQPQTGRWQSTE